MVAAVAVLVCAHSGRARLPNAPQVLTETEGRAVVTCMTLVRGCQLPDGAFAQVSPGDKTNAPVWIAPYFASYAALALLAGQGHKQNSDDLSRVGRWLAWCAKSQSADGYWTDFEGTATAYTSNGKVDAWDSSAALFLLVAGRYHRAGGHATPALTAAAKKALTCIETVTGQDGLTWATPTHKIKYLMDNIEVCAGLRAGATFFHATGAEAEAARADDQAGRIAKRLPDYWLPADNLYAYALHANGSYEGGLGTSYPHGLAQLFGIAFIAPKAAAWASVSKTLAPETGPASAAGTEWWLIAASRLPGNAAEAWRARLVKEVAAFTPQAVYISRPALAALGLLEGADWMLK